jgi:glucose/arabinose dehydrogenase
VTSRLGALHHLVRARGLSGLRALGGLPALPLLASLAAADAGCGGTGSVASPGAETLSAADATVGDGPSLQFDAAAGEARSASPSDASGDAEPDVPLNDAASLTQGAFCSLPGSVIWTATGPTIVPGGNSADPDMSWLKLPPGYCAHFFAQVDHTRQLRFAPGGDLFVASPSTDTPGGTAFAGLGEVLVLPDDNHDGVADSQVVFFPNAAAGQPAISSTQGLMFANGYFYYEDVAPNDSETFYIRRVAFRPGDRAPSASVETVTTISATGTPPVQQAPDHWSKVMDIAQDGTIYVTNGSNQGQGCYSPSSPQSAPFGAIFKINPDGSISEVERGFRNPIALRCESNHNVCLAVELALDGSGDDDIGREKIVPVRQGDDWGFPCCATTNTPYQGEYYLDTNVTPDCSGVTQETVSFIIGHTPFGIDFEPGKWPPPWTGRVFAVLHGVVGSWEGARIVGIALDPTTGNLLPASELYSDAATAQNMLDLATGWYDEEAGVATAHGRPSAIAFAPDGRAFIGDDYNGLIAWIAPVGLAP